MGMNLTRPVETLTLRPAAAEDTPGILALYARPGAYLVTAPLPNPSSQVVSAALERAAQAQGLYCVFELAGSVVGAIEFIPAGYQQEVRTAGVQQLLIQPGQPGLDSAALDVLEAMLIAWHVVQVCVDVHFNNPAALRFWQGRGYGIIGGPELQADQAVVYHLAKSLPLLPTPTFR